MKAPRFGFSINVDRHGPLSLQQQVRQRIIDALSHGVLRPGRRLPSTRLLAAQTGLSRNTITLAYDALLAEGHLESRARSGIYVPANAPVERVTTGRRGLRRVATMGERTLGAQDEPGFRVPPNWLQYPHPFIDGCIEPELLPVEGWREALRLSFSKQDLLRWGTTGGDSDDARFIDELRTKVLPSWGVDAGPDEVLGTVSSQQALHLVIASLVERGTPVVFDAGIDADVQRQVLARGATLAPLRWDGSGPELASPLPRAAVLLAGSRRATPGTIHTRERCAAVLNSAAENRATIIECVQGADLLEPARETITLRSLARGEPVVSVGALAAVTALGTAPGVVHGDARLIERIRALRRHSGAEFPGGMQRAWAYFIGLGHYAGALARANVRLLERRTALRDALNHYLHRFVRIETRPGSSAYWISGGPQWNAAQLARAAANIGVLIEPISAPGETAQFCMGVTSIRAERIRAGVQELARIVRADPKLGSRTLRDETVAPLVGAALQRALAGATLLYNTVYGEPCTIRLAIDGTLSGRAGYSNEDRDSGRWWVEGDRWYRQWQHWAYGESAGLITVIEGEQVRWYNADGLFIDTAVIVRQRGARA
ncbi:MAG: PLP-dependent aminotransferase family protein [Steroidobacteraceae bacterium]